MQQAALTGESLPVEKNPDPGPRAAKNPVEMTHAVFLGSSVVSGNATAVVCATGSNTVFEVDSEPARRGGPAPRAP